eukprot:scaffold128261_cov19-Tisochrysis_lutea.AAC.1
MQRISLTCGLSGGLTPYMKPAIWVRRSAMQMNFFSRFLGITKLRFGCTTVWRREHRCVLVRAYSTATRASQDCGLDAPQQAAAGEGCPSITVLNLVLYIPASPMLGSLSANVAHSREGILAVPDIVRVDINVIHAQVQVCCRDCTDAPLCLGAEGGLCTQIRHGKAFVVQVHGHRTSGDLQGLILHKEKPALRA